MAKNVITSKNQKGGITAKNVNINGDRNRLSIRDGRRSPRSKRIVKLAAAIIGSIASILTVLEYLDIINLIQAMSTEKQNISITSHNQMGGVTAHTVNIGPQARQMNDQLGEQLLQAIPKTANVKVVAVLGDGEGFAFANQVLQWLRSNGYAKAEGVDQVVYAEPVVGQIIIPKSGNDFELVIGTRPH